MSRRGTQLASELRYLRPEQYNQLNLEFLSSDQVVAHADKRYLAYWLHQGHFGSNWHSYLEYTKVSDDNYFNDFGSSVAGKTDNRLEQTATLSYLSEDFDADISLSEFEVFGNYAEVYRQVPRINMTYRIPQFSDYE